MGFDGAGSLWTSEATVTNHMNGRVTFVYFP